jgi:hypothetical protein
MFVYIVSPSKNDIFLIFSSKMCENLLVSDVYPLVSLQNLFRLDEPFILISAPLV